MSVPIAFKLSSPNDNDLSMTEFLNNTSTNLAATWKSWEIWVEWTTTNQSFPATTAITESNVAAVIQLLELRRGVDVLKGSLPEASQ
ncbi:hypothetical protein VC83_07078 [Pseudogymnoascus destructans]|uniref:Uncharacterized protein n=1 Tax=Pseudogymnoascus destructans TaxID=655981 RepID=A0A177A754_9PEZI|nr:uncharacterized protein VC83_07078 [Pseudogymnoascus destructans]OAF56854.1 hypothetical protein VC83_07078 [Pseudogymnoascus destructans]